MPGVIDFCMKIVERMEYSNPTGSSQIGDQSSDLVLVDITSHIANARSSLPSVADIAWTRIRVFALFPLPPIKRHLGGKAYKRCDTWLSDQPRPKKCLRDPLNTELQIE